MIGGLKQPFQTVTFLVLAVSYFSFNKQKKSNRVFVDLFLGIQPVKQKERCLPEPESPTSACHNQYVCVTANHNNPTAEGW